MQNKERYFQKIVDIAFPTIALDVRTGELTNCGKLDCKYCAFDKGDCDSIKKIWLEQQYVDWNEITENTLVTVSDDGITWYEKHFAKYEKGKVFVWSLGRLEEYNFAKLIEGGM